MGIFEIEYLVPKACTPNVVFMPRMGFWHPKGTGALGVAVVGIREQGRGFVPVYLVLYRRL